MKSIEETILADRQELELADKALNGPVYPPDSLHAQGFRSPSCSTCILLTYIDYLLGDRETRFITPGETAAQARRTRKYEFEYPEEAKINNLYRILGG